MQTDIETTTGTRNVQQDIHGGAATLTATAPGQLRVIKRNGTVVPFDASKIAIAMTKAFLAVEGGTAAASTRVHETVNNLTQQITATFKRRSTLLPTELPVGLSDEFAGDASRQALWAAFLRKNGLKAMPLGDVVGALRERLQPALGYATSKVADPG